MSGGLRIDIETRPFERVDADVAVTGLYEDDRPLRGGAARADWRLCGLISSLILDERITGAAGEALLVPSAARLRAPRILILGLGPRATRSGLQVQDLVLDAMTRVRDLGLADMALTPLGFAGDEWPLRAQAVVDGAIEATAGADGPTDLRLVVSSGAEPRARASVGAVIDALGRADVQLVRREGRDPAGPVGRPRRSPQGHSGIHRTL